MTVTSLVVHLLNHKRAHLPLSSSAERLTAMQQSSCRVTNLSTLCSASLNLLPRSFSPVAVTQSWLRNTLARDAGGAGQEPISRAVEGKGRGRGVTLTGLLPVGGPLASPQRHRGQQLAQMEGRAEVWHRAAEVEQVVDTVSGTHRETESVVVRNIPEYFKI